MSDLSGSAAVGIDRVEWSSEGGGNLVIQVTGRWRRRRPAFAGQPTLVLEAEGRRHRFPAMPEPPSLAGAGPGSWRLSFTVPGWLAPSLSTAWLTLGAVVVPLPPPSAQSEPVAAPAHAELATPVVEPSGPPGPVEPAAFTPQTSRPAAPEPPSPPRSAARSRLLREAAAAASTLATRLLAAERELRELRARDDALRVEVAEHERGRRLAEQRAHAENELRRDLERRLDATVRDAVRARQAMGELAAAEERIRSLERDLGAAGRRSDEAEQAAAAAGVARRRAEQELAFARQERDRLELDRERLELELAREVEERERGDRARVTAERRLTDERAAVAVRAPREPPMTAAPAARQPPDAGLVEPLREALEAQALQDAALRARLVEAEARIAAHADGERRTAEALRQLRGELDGLASRLARERHRREQAEARAARLDRELDEQRSRSRFAYEAIGELRGAVRRPPEPAAPPKSLESPESSESRESPVSPGSPAASPEPRSPPPAGAVEPERLTDALARLRQTIAPPDADTASPSDAAATPHSDAETASPPAGHVASGASPQLHAAPEPLHAALSRRSLEAPFRRLVRISPDVAGRLLLELLPLQWSVHPEPVAYDLVLGTGRGCVSVTSRDGEPQIAIGGSPRPRDAIDFQVLGEPARIARMLTAGRWRRRFGRRMARVRGRRARLAALSALLTTPLDLSRLRGAGVHLDAATTLALVAQLIDPDWTDRELFTLRHVEPGGACTYLIVRQALPPVVSRTAPEGRVSTTLECPGDELLEVLAGGDPAGVAVSGDGGPLRTVRGWLARASAD